MIEFYMFILLWIIIACMLVIMIERRIYEKQLEGITEMRNFKLSHPIGSQYRISQGFGARYQYYWTNFKLPGHEGIDWAAPEGTPVLAAADGVIKLIAKDDKKHPYGNQVRIVHTGFLEGTFETVYAHLSRFAPNLKKGVEVRAGDIIGYSGNTGNSDGPHLHFVLKWWGATAAGYKSIVAGNKSIVFPLDVVNPLLWLEL